MRSLCKIVLLFLAVPSVAGADLPNVLTFQGRLMGPDGNVATGMVRLRFALFGAATGGNALWCEEDRVGLADGYYALNLGGGAPCAGITGTLAAALDGSDRFLELAVEDTPLSPRQRIGMDPYAFLSASAQNVVGGVVKASSVTISSGGTLTVGGAPVIDASGELTGAAAYSPGVGLELTGRTFSMLTSCSTGQVLQWDGSVWACANVPRAYAQLEGPTQTFAANSWTGTSFTASPVAQGVSVSGKNLTFARAGVYLITVTFRMDASCSDVWTAARLYGNLVDVGHSAGSGTASPGPATYSFLANVTLPSANHQLQIGRANGACSLLTPIAVGDTTPPAIQVTIVQVG